MLKHDTKNREKPEAFPNFQGKTAKNREKPRKTRIDTKTRDFVRFRFAKNREKPRKTAKNRENQK